MNVCCPQCKKTINEKLPGIWPFCSRQCKMVDLGSWMREEYTIAGPPASEEDLYDAMSQQSAQTSRQDED